MTAHTPVANGGAPRLSAVRVAVVLGVDIVLAIALNSVVALVATRAGATSGFPPLTLPVYGAFTAVGILVGWIGWRLIARRARQPRAVLSWLVPLVGLLSFIPDVALGILRFIPGATWAGVAGLMVMHLVVIALAVPAYARASRVG